jgi:amino acid adenylation domain-containing protein
MAVAAAASDRCVHDLFQARAVDAPDAPALVTADRQLTYRELDRRSNQLARHLIDAGVGPDTVVGLMPGRSSHLVVGALAILKAGGAYLPLDESTPGPRLRFMLEDSGARRVLTLTGLRDRLPAGLPTVCLDGERHALALQSASALPGRALAANLAYVIYTSGSTGQPKGVAVPHQALANLVRWHQQAFALQASDRASMVANVGFDAAVWELWPYLAAGSSVYLADHETRTVPERLIAWMAASGITIAFLPTPMAEAALQLKWPASCRLRRLLTGGDRLRLGPDHHAPCELVNNYGPTECTVVSTSRTVAVGPTAPALPGIGRPISQVRAHLLDATQGPVAAGEPGEICIGGAGLARGYLNAPDLTAERFQPDPFGLLPGERIYHTGDLARSGDAGDLEFLGRIDQQVKIRGYRIEPAEVEAALLQHPQLGQAAVMRHEDGAGGGQLIAYCVPAAAGAELDPHAIGAFLRGLLPDYMAPSLVVPLAALPLSPNGKIDRRALPLPGAASAASAPLPPASAAAEDLPSPAPVAAAAEVERLWRELLPWSTLSPDDDFFAHGGNSLLATRLLSRVREACGVDLSLREFFAVPTLAGAAAALERAMLDRSRRFFQALRPLPRGEEIPLSFAQRRVWFLQRMHPRMLAYHFQAILHLSGGLRVAALRASLQEIVRRHEIFRTTFPAVAGRPVQRIHATSTVSLPVIDFTALPEERRQPAARRALSQLIGQPFDLSALPLARWVLARLGAVDHWLLHLEHHLVHDGWSFNVFLGELAGLYGAACSAAASPLPELPLQFADFARWQRQWLESEDAARQLAYWRQQLVPPPAILALPHDHPRPAAQRFRGDQCRVELPSTLLAGAQRLGRSAHATLFETLLATFDVLLHRYTGQQEDLAVGCGIANRHWPGTERLIGMILNTLVLRQSLSGRPSFRQLLARVRSMTREAYAHQDVPFEKLVDLARADRDPSHNPLFDVAFSFHDAMAETVELPGLQLGIELGVGNASAKFDLNVITVVQPRERGGAAAGAAEMIWEFDTALFDRTTVLRMAAHFRSLLSAAVAGEERPISELPMLASHERQQLIHEWGTSRPGGDAGASIPRLFTAAARQRPDATAVTSGRQQLSYGALDRRANQLARHLRRFAIGHETTVAICAERSLELVVAALAVLKAGAAYVALDPAYPVERLALLLAASGASLALTQDHLVGRLPRQGPRLLCLDRQATQIAAEAEGDLGTAVDPDQLAYVAYTSGSTGVPKGVAVPHRGVVRLVRDTSYASFGAGEVFLHLAPFSFDASTMEIWGPLLNGGEVVLAPPGPLSLRDIGLLLQTGGMTGVFLTAGLFHRLVESQPESLAGLRQLIAGGDVLSVDHVRAARRALPSCRLTNGYGPTESTTFTACFPIATEQVGSSVPIGRPIPDTEVYVVDRNGQLAPTGSLGELWIGGRGLARGYAGDPVSTADRFVPHPFAGAGARAYRTGDLVRWLPDGILQFHGRIDRQLKVRGFRIELGEIEAHLVRHPAVRSAVVVGRGRGADRWLAAYLVAAAAPAPSPEQLRAFLRARLPEHMIPGVFLTLSELPLTAIGKLDLAALPEPEARLEAQGVVHAMPRGMLEAKLAAVWEELLEVPQVGIDDTFFDLGGNSFRMLEVHQRLERELGREIPILAFFHYPTIRVLARYLGGGERPAEDVTAMVPGLLDKIDSGKDRLRLQRRRLAAVAAGLPAASGTAAGQQLPATGEPDVVGVGHRKQRYEMGGSE